MAGGLVPATLELVTPGSRFERTVLASKSVAPAKYMSAKEVAQWLLVNSHALPADLKEFEWLLE